MTYIDMTGDDPEGVVDLSDSTELHEIIEQGSAWAEQEREAREDMESACEDARWYDETEDDMEGAEMAQERMTRAAMDWMEAISEQSAWAASYDTKWAEMDLNRMRRQGMAQSDTYMIDMLCRVAECRESAQDAWERIGMAEDALAGDYHDRNTLNDLESAQEDMEYMKQQEDYWTIMVCAEMDRK